MRRTGMGDPGWLVGPPGVDICCLPGHPGFGDLLVRGPSTPLTERGEIWATVSKEASAAHPANVDPDPSMCCAAYRCFRASLQEAMGWARGLRERPTVPRAHGTRAAYAGSRGGRE
jgi:hypothetical protein